MARAFGRVSILAGLVALAGCAQPMAQGPAAQGPALGLSVNLGNGSVTPFAETDAAGAPKAIGVMFTATALENLPNGTDGHACFDKDRNGKIDPATECLPTFEFAMPLPTELARRADIPFKWALLNWNPAGHLPPGIYDTPHFDVHFMIEPIQNIYAIHPGPCGPEMMRCDQFAIGRKPVPVNYAPDSHIDVGAIVPAMGNHLLDVGAPEFKGKKFERTMIFGAYDGRITFYEEMVDRAFMLTKPSRCSPITQPEAVAISGYYPTQTCVRFLPAQNTYVVTMEGFAMRQASAPGAPRAVPPLPPGPPPIHRH